MNTHCLPLEPGYVVSSLPVLLALPVLLLVVLAASHRAYYLPRFNNLVSAPLVRRRVSPSVLSCALCRRDIRFVVSYGVQNTVLVSVTEEVVKLTTLLCCLYIPFVTASSSSEIELQECGLIYLVVVYE